MSAWRQAGLNYINFSNIAARILRQSLKADAKNEAAKREVTNIKFTPWVNGKPARKEVSSE